MSKTWFYFKIWIWKAHLGKHFKKNSFQQITLEIPSGSPRQLTVIAPYNTTTLGRIWGTLCMLSMRVCNNYTARQQLQSRCWVCAESLCAWTDQYRLHVQSRRLLEQKLWVLGNFRKLRSKSLRHYKIGMGSLLSQCFLLSEKLF